LVVPTEAVQRVLRKMSNMDWQAPMHEFEFDQHIVYAGGWAAISSS
jgi:hypothetical protein